MPRSSVATLVATLVFSLASPAQAQSTTAPPIAEPAHAPSRGAPVENGFAFEVNLGTTIVTASTGSNTAANPAFEGGFFLGGKRGRLIFGAGFELGHGEIKQKSGSMELGTSVTTLGFTPGVRFSALRTLEGRLELVGLVDVSLGGALGAQAGTGTGSTSGFRFGWHVGPGMRYWVAPRFAINGVTGLGGTHLFFNSSQGALNISTTLSAIFVFVDVGVLAVF